MAIFKIKTSIMKNFILSAFLAVTIATSAFATGENKISSVVLNHFKVDFQDATNVSWSSNTGYAKAAFTWEKHEMEVFYDIDGSIHAMSTKIELDELPVNAKRTFAKTYQGYTVKEAIKFIQASEEAYFLKVENDAETVVIKVEPNQELYLFKKSKKVK